VTPTEWAETHRVLPPKTSAEPGKYRVSRTPYARGVADAVIGGAEEIVFVAGTQIGKTTIEETLLGYWIDEDPGPCLIVKPTQQACRDYVAERIRPMLDASPRLRRHRLDNKDADTLDKIELDSMTIYFGWAGSPQSLASRPCRYVLVDEVDKFPAFSGREADPVSLARERTATFGHRRRVILTSTPTTRDGAIWRAFEACGDKRRFHVPCPHCGTYQLLTWPQVRWPKLNETSRIKRADTIEQDRLAWYECSNPQCRGRIEDSHKPRMLDAGTWASEGQSVNNAGHVSGERPVGKKIGLHLNSLYSPWRRFADMAAEWIRADGDLAATMNFRNARLAEPFEVQVSRREPSAIEKKEQWARTLGQAGQARVAPSWSVLLLATCDVQKDHCYYSVSAWGYELKSKRLLVGVAATLDEVYRQVFAPDFPFVSDSGVPVAVNLLVVDSGYRKDEVTEFAQRDPRRVHLSRGLPTYFGPIAHQKIERASGVVVWNINTMQSKDTLDRLIGDPQADRWQVYAGIPEDFFRQMTAEHKVVNPQTRQMEWREKSSGAANHYWDTEAVACAVASAMGAAAPAPEPVRQDPPSTSDQTQYTNPLTNYRRW